MDEKKITMRSALKMHRRAVGTLRTECPGLFASIFSYAAAKALTPYVTIYLSALIINELAGARDVARLWRLVVITIVATALCAVVTAALNHRKTQKTESAWFRGHKVYTDKFLDMDFAALDGQRTHDLHAQVRQNENWSGWGLYRTIQYTEKFSNAALTILGAAALTVTLFTSPVPASAGKLTVLNSPLFTVGLAALLIGATVLAPALSNRTESAWANCAADARLGNRYFIFFGFMALTDRPRALDIRVYNQQNICRRYVQKENVFTTGSKLARLAAGPMGLLCALSACVSVVFTGIVYVFVCLKAWAGAFGVGSVTQYIGAVTALSAGVGELIRALGGIRNNAEFLKTSFELLDIPNEMYQGSLTTEKRSDRKYEVEFRDVSFKYPNTDVWALRHVSMRFKVGSRLAVVGMNGSGKTTFIKLLCRLYDPTKGEILLNGIDIRKYNYADYMSIFSVVFQDFKLLSYPLGQNVAASKDYDRERVIDALDKAGFETRLETLPKGVDTCLYREFEEDGVEVSGGEAQKIAIARALYKDAPFIVLDEPTAALDPIAEAEIYEKFNDIAGDKTAIYISHRLSSCKFCDEIAVFDHGGIVQQGTHDALVADESGKYHELWYAQAQYYTK